jgi:folate-binding protein YgfZ
MTDVITSPLLDYFVSLGFNYDRSNGRKVFKCYTSTEAEINSLYYGVGLVDLSSEGIFELKGKDVLDFLHRITTNSVKDLPKEGICNTIFTSEKGKIIDASSILNFEDHQLLVCSSVNKIKVKNWIEKYIIADDVKISETPDKYVLLQLSGPQAESFLTLICGNILNNIQPDRFRVINAEGILFFAAKFIDQKNNPLYWILSDNFNGKKIISFINDIKGPFDFKFIGEDAWNTYRIEQGIPTAPNEINDRFNPHELNLLGLVSFTKGCYIGQEVITRLRTYDKVQKRLFGVVFNELPGYEEQFTLYDNEGNEVGVVTSTVFSYKFKKFIGIGIIRNTSLEEGIQLTAKSPSKSLKVTLHSLPFRK